MEYIVRPQLVRWRRRELSWTEAYYGVLLHELDDHQRK